MGGKRVVIVGAGVAGLTAAWWLHRNGWEPLLVERAHDLRAGGYMMGLSGPGLETVKEMGLFERLKAISKHIDENVFRDRTGRIIMRFKYHEFMDGIPYLVLQRTALIEAIRDVLPGDVEILFGQDVALIDQNGDGATVNMSDGKSIDADLVIGADGMRSFVRRHVFGADDQFFVPLGYRFAAYDIANTLGLDCDFASYVEPGRMTEYYGLNNNRLAAVHIWKSDETGFVPSSQRWDLIESVAKTSHRSVQDLTRSARETNETMILDDLTMVAMPSWSNGRIYLLGDAAHCLTLVSGQGAGISMASAALLAEELGKAPIPEALARHQARLRPSIMRLQKRSENLASVFIPATPVAFGIRNLVFRIMPKRWIGRYFANAIKSEILATSTA